MTRTTTPVLLPGVDRHRDRYRVRKVFPAPYGRVFEFYDTPAEANAASLELDRRRKAGLPPSDKHGDLTLADAAAALLARKRVSGKRGPLRAGGLKHWQIALRPWLEGEHAQTPLSLLRRDRLEDAILVRAAEHPTTARNELEGLKAALRYAGNRGARFDPALLTIDSVNVTRRRRRALTAEQLEFLAKHAPDYARRLLLFMGTTGMRSGEVFTLTDDRVDLDARTVFVPAELCKEGVDKTIPLSVEEVTLVREQLGGLRVAEPSATAHLPARPAGTSLVWPKAGGGQWSTSRGHFHKLVWGKALRRSAEAWRAQHDLPADAETPFCGLTPHDLRSTAATLMRDARMSRDEAAERLGHADGGKLLADVYDQGDRAARVAKALDEAAPEGLRAKLTEPARQRSRTSAASADSASREPR